MTRRSRAFGLFGVSMLAGLVGACLTTGGSDAKGAAVESGLVHVQLLAFNDFHGNLAPPSGSSGIVTAKADDPTAVRLGTAGGVKFVPATETSPAVAQVPAGGVVHLAGHVRALEKAFARGSTVVVSAGDLTGGSPLVSNVFRDHPAVLVMNELGLDYNAVGNHEFDRGLDALLTLSRGCSPKKSDSSFCSGGPFDAAKFKYLAANVVNRAENRTIFPEFEVRDVGGAKVAFIGMTLENTPKVTVEKNVEGLAFQDEVETVNRLVPLLKSQEDVSAIVVLVHEGGRQKGTYDDCEEFSGDILPIAQGLDPAVDVIVSAHTHQAYNCLIGGRIVTSAASFGRVLTRIELELDPVSRSVVKKKAENVIVTRDTSDTEVESILARIEAQSATLRNAEVAKIGSDLSGRGGATSAACESTLGDVIADAQLASSKKVAAESAIAFMNPGGIRTDLVFVPAVDGQGNAIESESGLVRYEEAFAVQPFQNNLVTFTLQGKQIVDVLKAQFVRPEKQADGSVKLVPRDSAYVLQVSKGFSYKYTYDKTTKTGTIDEASITVGGAPLDLEKRYVVVANSFLADGGDDFPAFKNGQDRKTGEVDLDAFIAFLKENSPLPARTAADLDRIKGNGCAP